MISLPFDDWRSKQPNAIPLNCLQQPNCNACTLGGTKKVLGYGTIGNIVIVGEAPGLDEHRTGIPFVGYSGSFLRSCLKEAGLDLDRDCYRTNACLCRPPSNRTPEESEIAACLPRLHSEILLAQPKKILLMGATAIRAVLNQSILEARGRYQYWNGIPVMSTYHPAFILRIPDAFRDFARDVEKISKEPCEFYKDEFIPYTVTENVEHSLSILDDIRRHEKRTIDIETRNVNPRTHDFLCHGLTIRPEYSWIVPDEIVRESRNVQSQLRVVLESGYNVIHNSDFEYQWYKTKYDIDLKIGCDTMLMHYGLDERGGGDEDNDSGGGSYHKLKLLGGLYFDAPDWGNAMKPYAEDFGLAPKDVLYRYLSLDLSVTHRLESELMVEAIKDNVVSPVNDVMIPAVPLLSEAEMTGVKIDREYFETLGDEWEVDIWNDQELLRQELQWPDFNFRSHVMVAKLLFDDLGLKKIRGRHADKKVMKKLEHLYPDNKTFKRLTSLRSKDHILSKDIRGMLKLTEGPNNDRLHTNFLIHATPHGRLASRQPALQNIPARIGPVIRDGFIVDDGWEFGEFDYEQLEFRVFAGYCQDPKIIAYINSGRDIHSEVACYYFHCTPEEVDKSRRLDAKAVVFGILYGRGAKSIAEEFNLTLKEAERRIGILREMFPQAFVWMAEEQARVLGKWINGVKVLEGTYESVTRFGRKRRYPLVLKQNKADIERYVINSEIAGTATDICLNSGGRIRKADWRDPETLRFHLFVHDSILFSWKVGMRDHYIPLIKAEMERDPFETPVKFTVEPKYGDRWGSLQTYEMAS